MTDWLNELLATHSALQTVVVLSIICSVGLALGKVRVGGVSLGVAFVFFIGILAGHLGLSIDVQTLDYAETFGLVVFVYMLGLHVGPHFFSSLRHEGMELNLWSFAVIALGTVMAVALTGLTDVSLPDMVGVLCGATTNTPALGAAQQALAHLGLPTGSAALATAVTYPLGVLGVILAMMLIRRLFVKPADLELRSQDADDQTYVGQFVVVNPALADKSVAEISQMSHLKFIISRIWRGQQVLVPQADTLLRLYDNVLVVTKKDDVGAMEILFGEKTETDWNGEKIDWNHIDAKVESRTLVLSRKVLNGKRLGHLQLRHTYGVNVSRITRGDIKLLATDDLRLQYGDRLTVVGEPRSLDNVEKFLGNAVQTLSEPNLAAIFIGIFVGIIFGAIPIAIPGVPTPVKLGLAGGPLIVAILIGRFGYKAKLVAYTTTSANLMLREIGLALFLASVGIKAGASFMSTVIEGDGLTYVWCGFLITILPILIVGVIARLFYKINYFTLMGMIAGSTTDPPALAFANQTANNDAPAVGYSTVYPLSMFLRILTAQLIILLLCVV